MWITTDAENIFTAMIPLRERAPLKSNLFYCVFAFFMKRAFASQLLSKLLLFHNQGKFLSTCSLIGHAVLFVIPFQS